MSQVCTRGLIDPPNIWSLEPGYERVITMYLVSIFSAIFFLFNSSKALYAMEYRFRKWNFITKHALSCFSASRSVQALTKCTGPFLLWRRDTTTTRILSHYSLYSNSSESTKIMGWIRITKETTKGTLHGRSRVTTSQGERSTDQAYFSFFGSW
jgi:hypothetical protein